MIQTDAERLFMYIIPGRAIGCLFGESLQDKRSPGWYLQVNLCFSFLPADACGASLLRHRIEKDGGIGLNTQWNPAVDPFFLQRGDKVMVSGRIRATDALQAESGFHLFPCDTASLQSKRIVGTGDDPSLLQAVRFGFVERGGCW